MAAFSKRLILRGSSNGRRLGRTNYGGKKSGNRRNGPKEEEKFSPALICGEGFEKKLFIPWLKLQKYFNLFVGTKPKFLIWLYWRGEGRTFVGVGGGGKYEGTEENLEQQPPSPND